MQKIFVILICFFSIINVQAQQPNIDYGNNPAAGKYLKIRGIKMYCEFYGNGEPLLLIHGNGGSINSFAGNIPYFAKKYKVIAVDSRSQGKSYDPQDSLSFEMMADDFAVLLDSLHIKNAYVLGWSDGGINALLLAMRHPEKVKKLVSTGANLWPDSTAIISSLWKEEKAYYDTSYQKKFTTPEEKNNWKLFLLDWFQPNIPLPALHVIKCQALIICGDHDLIRVQHTKLIAENIPNSTLWVVPNSGHATLREHKDEFDAKADQFFKDALTHKF
jgi:pimeloyl-ACP methyl ester carboxylesterase